MKIEFEKWFMDQDFYINMRFIHGDNLFSKDGDVYRVLPVQMTYKAWSENQSEYAELKEVSVALNTETINQRRYMASQQFKIEQLEGGKLELEYKYKALDALSRMRAAVIRAQKWSSLSHHIKNAIKNLDRKEKALRGDS